MRVSFHTLLNKTYSEKKINRNIFLKRIVGRMLKTATHHLYYLLYNLLVCFRATRMSMNDLELSRILSIFLELFGLE